MLIYLFRHGIAEQNAASDAARGLSREGVLQTQAVAEKFKLYVPQVDVALMSPLQRARQTASMLQQIFPALNFDVTPGLEPESDVYALLETIEKMNVQNMLLVGHNPLLSNMLSLLVDGTLESSRYVAESNLYCVEMDLVAPGCGVIRYFLEP